ncbi:pilus assembly protein CpaF [Micromonospora globispora]|uniref:CpaF family protein n=1 Tax=Micromonospora globispora TaxID=1450148 RepID=UPI000D6F1FB8|nr:CpaF family protein [Micromonospora globispora]PWU62164.1 pilus assembly protein CpaF [Micromonospora globispora]RQW99770.1 pilus assembly protein CpaF [Micromonospora globispora]
MSLSDRLAQRYPAGGDSGRTTRTSGSITRTSGPITGPTVGTSTSTLRLRIHRELLDILGPQLYDNRTPDSVLEKKVRDTINEVLARSDSPLAVTDSARISAELLDEILGHGPVEPLLRDPDVTEIMVNGPDQIFVERFGRIHQVDASFVDEQHLRRVIDRIVSRVGRRVDESSPMVDARLPDGSRVNVVLPPVALDGSVLTIRKFARDAFTTEDLIGFGTFTPEVAQFLYACVRARLDIVISGGTGSGKTTTLNVLSSFLPPDERIVTIEDAAELQLRQNHVLRLESRPPNIEGRGEISVRDLVRNALRMRPDRIVIGEVRDGAALDLLQAMNTGHNGSLTTVHANSPRDSVARLETMSLMAGLELPVRAIREQIASAVDLVVHQSRLRDGSRRVTHVTEVLGMEGDVVTMQDLFVFDHRAGHDEHGRHLGTLRWTGLRPRLLDTLADAGVPVPVGLFEGRPW